MPDRSPALVMWSQLSTQHDQILYWMRREKMIDTHEIQMWVTNNTGLPVLVTSISYVSPDLVVFSGTNKEATTFILKHPHQVDVTFNVVKASGQPTKLGFVHKQPT